MEYNLHGKRTKLIDPDAGEIQTKYNGFGEVIEEKQKIHNANTWTVTTNTYLQDGRLDYITRNGEITQYTYDENENHPARIKSIEISGQHKQSFEYDNLDRITKLREQIDGKTIDRGTTYDVFGRVKRETYNTGYYTENHYDKNGYLTKVTDKAGRNIWQALEENEKGQITKEKKGDNIVDYGYDDYGFPAYVYDNSGYIDWGYHFNQKGNLIYRQNYFTGNDESFIYDSQNRLTNWNVNGSNQLNSITYNSTTGNIQSKGDLGAYTFNYGERGYPPHALTSINGVPASFPLDSLKVTYTDFRKMKTLEEGNKYYTLTYGVDAQRRKSVYKENNTAKETRYYFGDYEEKINHTTGITEKIHYLCGAIYIERSNGINNLYYAYNDNIGSLILLTNEDGSVAQRYAYDPWGKRRNPSNWTESLPVGDLGGLIVNRGYTMHEHIDQFGIINMNGRVYDPLTAQFFSPDPYLQDTDNWLNYNRYAYAFGNPFKYIDPTGMYSVVYNGVTYRYENGQFYRWVKDESGNWTEKLYIPPAGSYLDRLLTDIWNMQQNALWEEWCKETYYAMEGQPGSYENPYNLPELVVAGTKPTSTWGAEQMVNFISGGLTAGSTAASMYVTNRAAVLNANRFNQFIMTDLSGVERIKSMNFKSGTHAPATLVRGGKIEFARQVNLVNGVKSAGNVANTLGNGANVVSTYLYFQDIKDGNASLITYADASVGVIGVINAAAATYFTGAYIPVVGEFVIVYGSVRTAWDVGWYLGANYGLIKYLSQ